jgi:hypothetical protein
MEKRFIVFDPCMANDAYRDLASYKRFETHLTTNWLIFSAKRSERLRQQGLSLRLAFSFRPILSSWQIISFSDSFDL